MTPFKRVSNSKARNSVSQEDVGPCVHAMREVQ
jgi:hypothetical protein